MKKKEKQQKPKIIQAEKPAKKSHKKRNIIIAVAVLCVIALFVDEPDDSVTSSIQLDTSVAASVSIPESAPQPEPAPQPKHTNVFMDAMVSVQPVMNGIKTEKIGEYACIFVDKEIAKAAPVEDFVQFVHERVEASDYNWWLVRFEDGTGIHFVGNSGAFPTYYGHFDDDSGVTNKIGILMPSFDDSGNIITGYTYETMDDE